MNQFMYVYHSDCPNVTKDIKLDDWYRDVINLCALFRKEHGGKTLKIIIDDVEYIYVESDNKIYVPLLRKDVGINIANFLSSELKKEVTLFGVFQSKKLGDENPKDTKASELIKFYHNLKKPQYQYKKGFNSDCFLQKDERYQCPCTKKMLESLEPEYHEDFELRKIIAVPRYGKAKKLQLLNYNPEFADVLKIEEFLKQSNVQKKQQFEETTNIKVSTLKTLIDNYKLTLDNDDVLVYNDVKSKHINTIKSILSKEYKLMFDFETINTNVPIKLAQMSGKDYMIEACVTVYDQKFKMVDSFEGLINPDKDFTSNSKLLNDLFKFCAKYMINYSYIFMSYNKSFENTVLQSLHGYYNIPKYNQNMQYSYGKINKNGKQVDLTGSAIIKDIVANNYDLMELTRLTPVKTKSLKNIYKLLCQKDSSLPTYEELNIRDGLQATNLYKQRMFAKESLTKQEYQDFLDYCLLDCNAMAYIFIDACKQILGEDVI